MSLDPATVCQALIATLSGTTESIRAATETLNKVPGVRVVEPLRENRRPWGGGEGRVRIAARPHGLTRWWGAE